MIRHELTILIVCLFVSLLPVLLWLSLSLSLFLSLSLCLSLSLSLARSLARSLACLLACSLAHRRLLCVGPWACISLPRHVSRQISGLSRTLVSEPREWKPVRYVIFDAPKVKGK